MKKSRLFFTGAFLLSTTLGMNAQVQRMVLSEAFSNASCGPCAAQNPGYNTLLAGNTSKVIAIKYQTNWPGFDPMNVQTQAQVGPRVTYYNVTGVPYGRLDGTDFAGPNYSGALANLDQTEIDTRYAITSPFQLTVTHSLSADLDSVTINVSATTPAVFSGTNLKLHVILTEREIDFASPPGSNGETVFHNVMRKMYTGTGGQAIPNSWTAAQSQNWTFNEALPNYIYNYAELSVVVFIQDDNGKVVHQAALSNPVTVNNYGITQNLAGLPTLDCDGSFNTATVQIKNFGSNTITSATVNYQIDAGTVQTAPFTGSIAAGGTANFNIPSVSGISGGAHTFTTWLTNVNNSGSTTAFGTTTGNFNIASNPVAAPLVQGFEGTFPPTNWIVDNSQTVLGWSDQPYGGNGVTGTSAMCFFWNMPAGETADIYAQRVDLSGMSSAYVNFDVAYTPFTAATPENDKLEVMVSTDCGATWSTLYNKAGSTLQTAPVVGNGAANGWFKPDLASEWRAESVNLSSVVGQSDVMVRFKGTSGFGDNLFVDNINISNTAITGVEETVVSEFSIYPNPAVDVVNVSLNLTETSKVNIQVVNNLGQTVILRNLGELTGTSINQVDISSLASGVYMMNIVVNGNVTVKQFVKN